MNNEAAPGDVGSFLVTSGGDVSDATDGVLTLREAIAEAKAAGVSATISFAAAIDTVTLAQGELLIDGTSAARGVGLTIDGGAGVRLVQGAATGRVMHIDGEADHQQVNLSSLFLKQGHVVDGVGGGLLAEGAVLNIQGCSFYENTVTRGSGTATLAGGGVALVDSLFTTISDSFIERNKIDATTIEATGTAEIKGGGLYAVGGGLRIHHTAVQLNAVTMVYGSARGGGIYAHVDDLAISQGAIFGNSLRAHPEYRPISYARGGGLDLAGPGGKIISYSSIVGNTASDGYTIIDSGGGGVAFEGGIAAIDHSYVGGNTSFRHGGGIASFGARLSLENSTVHGNGERGGLDAGAGGVYLSEGYARIVGATITGNSANFGSGGVYAGGADLVPRVANSIIAGNVANNASRADVVGTIMSNQHNLFGQATVAGSAPSDLVGTDPMLGPPDQNGGTSSTRTLALLPGSPAADAGNPRDALGTTDQRGEGFARIVDGKIDIGAFQRQPIESVERLFTPGDDTVDLRKVDLVLHPGALGTVALAGDDTVHLSATQNLGTRFLASLGDDVIVGSPHLDRIAGSSGDDRLVGARGDDRLRGGGGDDRLLGDGGDDTLTGGAGADRFVFRTVGDSPTGADRDVIRDFTSRHGDLIVLDKIDANPALAGDQAFVWKADDPLTGIGQLHYRHLGGGDTIIEGNLSGSAAPELQILLHEHRTADAGDFLL